MNLLDVDRLWAAHLAARRLLTEASRILGDVRLANNDLPHEPESGKIARARCAILDAQIAIIEIV